MNSLGIALLCSALQATLLGLLAAALYGLACCRSSTLRTQAAIDFAELEKMFMPPK